MKQLILRVQPDLFQKIKQRAFEEEVSINKLLTGWIGKELEPFDPTRNYPHPTIMSQKMKGVYKGLSENIIDITYPEPVIIDDIHAKIKAQEEYARRCEAPNTSCHGEGKKYRIGFMTDEGIKKKELRLCPLHLKKARGECESVEESL